MKRWTKRGLSLSHANPGTQPAHHMHPIIVSFEVQGRLKTKLMTDPKQLVGVHRQIDIRSCVRIHTEEFRRSHTHNSERQVVDLDRLANSVCGSSETAFAERVADHGHCFSSPAIVAGIDQTSAGRVNTKSSKVVARHCP